LNTSGTPRWFADSSAVSYTSASAIGFRSERGPILISVMLSTGLVAIDATVLATAIPTIVRELGGFELFPWLFSVYLLGQSVTTPIYAKLSDSFGRKPVLLVGITVFLLGSVFLARCKASVPARYCPRR
jgi:MFS family permease